MPKEKLGFKTSATDLEEKFEKVQELLAGKKANWTRLSALSREQLLQERQALEEKKTISQRCCDTLEGCTATSLGELGSHCIFGDGNCRNPQTIS